VLADPACGDASIANIATLLCPGIRLYLNDISKPQVEKTRDTLLLGEARSEIQNMDAFDHVDYIPRVDVIVLTEILEHLDDPDSLVRKASEKATNLVASSPIGETGTSNHEHTWGWDEDGYYDMLTANGWQVKTVVKQYMNHMGLPYNFQIWTAKSTNL
jgi:hypothetical protein